MSIQTQMDQMDQSFNQVPLAHQYSTDSRIDEIGSPRHFSADSRIDALGSPTTIQSSPTNYSEMSSAPDSAHSTLYFPGPTSQPFTMQDDSSSVGYQPPVAIEEIPQEPTPQDPFTLDSKSMVQMQIQFEEPMAVPQNQPIPQVTYYDGIPYHVSMDQYYTTPAPTWYTNIKPEETWPGMMPSERMNTFYQ